MKHLFLTSALLITMIITVFSSCESNGDDKQIQGNDVIKNTTDDTTKTDPKETLEPWDVKVPEDTAQIKTCGNIDPDNIELKEGEELLNPAVCYQEYEFAKTECAGGVEDKNGKKWLNGTWRNFWGFFDEQVELDQYGNVISWIPDPSEYWETWEFDGDQFVNVMKGEDLGHWIEAKMTGYYFCETQSQDPLQDKYMVFVVEKVEPEGAFGNYSGTVFPCVRLENEFLNNILMWFYFDWDFKKSQEYKYAKCKNDECTKF